MMIVIDGDRDIVREMIRISSAHPELRIIIIDDSPKKKGLDHAVESIAQSALEHKVCSNVFESLGKTSSQVFIEKKNKYKKPRWQR